MRLLVVHGSCDTGGSNLIPTIVTQEKLAVRAVPHCVVSFVTLLSTVVATVWFLGPLHGKMGSASMTGTLPGAVISDETQGHLFPEGLHTKISEVLAQYEGACDT